MTNIFKIQINCSETNIQEFNLAFKDIYELSKLLCYSKNMEVKEFIANPVPGDLPWLAIRDHNVIVLAECKEVIISEKDFKFKEQIEYDFGKRSPADDVFIFAFMSIIKHYIKDAHIFREVDPYKEDFDDGVRLARVVNQQINNPYRGNNIIYSTPYTKYVEKICESLNAERT